MADKEEAPEAETEEGAEGAGADGGEAVPRKMPGKKLVLFVVAPIMLLLAAGAGVYFSGLADSLLGKGEGEDAKMAEAEAEPGPSVFFDLPDMLVNLNTSGRRTGYLKLSVSLELGSEEDQAIVEKVLPRVIDNFQVYLRELRIEDLQGSAGMQRLREELLTRVVTAAEPAEVRDVLFREILIQ